jgi:predicted transcriptional regulator
VKQNHFAEIKKLGLETKVTRKSLGLTQVELSKAIDISQSKLSKVEHGQLEFTATEYLRFLKLKEKR